MMASRVQAGKNVGQAGLQASVLIIAKHQYLG